MMLGYALDWVGLLVRWLHVIAGIAWIGASFYFVWLDNHLQPLGAGEPSDPRVAGELWAVHGGGFYRSQKYRVAPATLPGTLHWFYWEAYTTWLSGFGLLCLLYFWQAEAYLIDPSVMPLSKPAAVGIAVAVLVTSWLVYDGLCRSVLAQSPRLLAALIAALVGAEAFGLTQVFSGRGAFMIFGASLGTLMVANVLFVIIPGQRELVHAKQQGREPDAAPGLRGKQRSVHNTYFTLPVVFVMISNHYAMTYGARQNWAVLLAMSFAGASIRAAFVARHRSDRSGPVGGGVGVPAAVAVPAMCGLVVLAALIIVLAPPFTTVAPNAAAATRVGSAEVRAIIDQRCVPCHATHPTEPGFGAAPNGIVLTNLSDILAHLPQVQQQLAAHAMPLGNLTGMTEQERSTVLMWIGHGARP